ncbi:MAG: ABC transporter permease [Anaerolineae bacterium]|nr:ABC transporter permease [Anaerolineae bacterium]
MIRFIFLRAVGLIGVLLAMTLIIFLLQQIIPSDPARSAAGPNAPRELVEAKRVELGLDQPVLVQYQRYFSRLLHGDLGTSIRTRNPVRDDLVTFLPASLELMVFAMGLGVLLGLLFALLQTLTPRGMALRLLLVGGASAPIFLLALLLLLLFWFRLDWLPGSSRLSLRDLPAGPTGLLTLDGLLLGRLDLTWDALRHLLLPGLSLALPIGVAVGRTLRSSLVNVLRQNYIRTAHSKGLSELRVIVLHALRPAATAPLAMIGLQVGLLFANLLIIERIFAWPGLGLYTVQALGSSDLPAVLGVSLVFGATYVLVNALVDLLQAWADPRISL